MELHSESLHFLGTVSKLSGGEVMSENVFSLGANIS